MSRDAYVVDDDDAVRASIAALLTARRGLSVTCFVSGDALRAAIPSLRPGIVVMDCAMPGSPGVATLPALDPHRFPAIMLTAHADVALVVSAMRAGAVDFVCKTSPPDDLLTAVDRALAQLEAMLVDEERRQDVAARLSRLSPRQREVLSGIIDGQRSKAIAADLSISVRTVELHRAHLFRKLGVSSQAALVRLAIDARAGA